MLLLIFFKSLQESYWKCSHQNSSRGTTNQNQVCKYYSSFIVTRAIIQHRLFFLFQWKYVLYSSTNGPKILQATTATEKEKAKEPANQ